jgi:hypothetical protein
MLNLFRRRADGRAIALPDRSISASDAARILSCSRADRDRAKVRAMARHLRDLRGLPPHPALEN